MEKKYLKGEDYLKLEAEMKKLGFDQIKAVDLVAGRHFLDIDQTVGHLPYFEIIDGDEIEATIKLERVRITDDYKITGYEMTLKKPLDPRDIIHNFHFPNASSNSDDGHKITKIEAYNLMNGRAVLKSPVEKETWLIMDFSRKNDSLKLNEIQSLIWTDYKSLVPENHLILEIPGNYLNLEVAIMKYHLKEALTGQERKKLIQAMRLGNRETATQIYGNEAERKVTIEAEPRFGIIKLFDEHGRRIKIIPPVISAKIQRGSAQRTGKIKL